MSKTLTQIQNDVIRRARISATDQTSIGNIVVDANDAIGIIASFRNWDELYKTNALSLALADGDKNYPLVTGVDKVEQVRIVSPVNYGRTLGYVLRKNILSQINVKSNNGTGTPSFWYYSEPTISSDNVETKNMSFDTMPDLSYTVNYTARFYPPLLVLASNQPFFDGNFHYIVEDFCIWRYAERNPDVTLNPDSFEAKWNDGVAMLLENYDSKVVDNVPIPGPSMQRFYGDVHG